MAFKHILRQRRAGPAAAAAGTLAIAAVLIPKRSLDAESPSSLEILPPRKPIYDPLPPTAKPSTPTENHARTTPSPTDRLAARIGAARLYLHARAAAAEGGLNAGLGRALALERRVTTTVAGLAPPASSGEKVLPGALYVAVAGMAGSMVVRSRGAVLRGLTPAGVGLAAAWLVLPRTARNVADLLWVWEVRWPVVAENHLRVRAAVREGVRMVRVHARGVEGWVERKVREGRGVVEGWAAKKG